MLSSNEKLKKLESVLEMSKLLNSTKDLMYILDALMVKSLEIIEGGDTGVVFLHNRQDNMLDVYAYAGFDDSVRCIRLRTDESMTGLAFTKKKTVFFRDGNSVKKAMNTMTNKNKTVMERAVHKSLDQIYGSICCPMIFRDECIGVIVIDNFENHAELTENDVQIIESISIQATIAIVNAQNYEKDRLHQRDLENYNRLLEDERNKYKYSTQLHSRFTNMVLNKSTTSDILREIAKLLNRDAFLIGRYYSLHSHSLDRFVSYEILVENKQSIIQNLKEKERTECLITEKQLQLNMKPIIVNMESLGWLCLVSEVREFSEMDNITVERGLTVLALDLLKEDELEVMEQSLKGDFLDNLILNQNQEYILKCGSKFQFNIDKPHQLLMFEIDWLMDAQDSFQDEKMKIRSKYYYRIIKDKAGDIFENPIVFVRGKRIIVIVEVCDIGHKEQVVALFTGVRTFSQELFESKYGIRQLHMGASNVIKAGVGFKAGYENVLQAIKLCRDIKPDSSYITYDDMGIIKFIMRTPQSERKQFVEDTLGPLIEYKRENQGDFLETLKIYVQSNGNWTHTKDALFIHGNTLTYRLKRIQELLQTDLEDYKQRMNIQMAFEILAQALE